MTDDPTEPEPIVFDNAAPVTARTSRWSSVAPLVAVVMVVAAGISWWQFVATTPIDRPQPPTPPEAATTAPSETATAPSETATAPSETATAPSETATAPPVRERLPDRPPVAEEFFAEYDVYALTARGPARILGSSIEELTLQQAIDQHSLTDMPVLLTDRGTWAIAPELDIAFGLSNQFPAVSTRVSGRWVALIDTPPEQSVSTIAYWSASDRVPLPNGANAMPVPGLGIVVTPPEGGTLLYEGEDEPTELAARTALAATPTHLLFRSGFCTDAACGLDIVPPEGWNRHSDGIIADAVTASLSPVLTSYAIITGDGDLVAITPTDIDGEGTAATASAHAVTFQGLAKDLPTDTPLAWTPDGRFLAWIEEAVEGRQLVVAPIAGPGNSVPGGPAAHRLPDEVDHRELLLLER